MTEQPLPLPQTQNRDLRFGRLEGLAEQFVEQSRETNVRLGRMEQTIAEQGRRINEQGRDLRQEIAAQGQQTNARFDRMEQTIDEQGSELRQAIDKQGSRIDEQGSELRQEIAAQGQQTNARFDRMEQAIDKQRHRIDVLTRWLVGMQIASLVALGTLILVRLP